MFFLNRSDRKNPYIDCEAKFEVQCQLEVPIDSIEILRNSTLFIRYAQ